MANSRPRRVLSLSLRLTTLFALMTVLILLAAMASLYFGLRRDLDRQADLLLAEKVHVLRQILIEEPGEEAPLREEVQWEAGTRTFTRYYSRVLDGEGRLVMETEGMARALAGATFPPPVPSDRPASPVSLWSDPRERSYRLVSALVAPGGPKGAGATVQVALDVSRDQDLLEDYRRAMAGLLLLGLAVSGLLGMAAARRGLRPLKAIANTASTITPGRLHGRVGEEPWPSELQELVRAFDAMLDRLEDSFLRLAQFSSDLAHELRTPINNLMGEAEVALSKPRTAEEYRRTLESSLEEYGRLATMIESLLFLARAEDPKTRIRAEVLDARAACEDVAAYYEPLAQEKGVALTCGGDGTVVADPALLRRALGNLVSNALQYTPSGGSVRLNAGPAADGGTVVRVEDSGVGIAPEDLPRLFDRFFRADRARSRHPQGTGLGLPIVRSIMELHGGSVRVESRAGEGTAVTLTFPQVG